MKATMSNRVLRCSRWNQLEDRAAAHRHRKLELGQLAYFVKVAEELHFGWAAAKLRQPQAPDRDPYFIFEAIKEG
ncbi:hypothetical protein [Rhizobium mongolense]|uniref:Uncharacterized protein n=2 Tax=Rhizobium mongolense TaxID=57676 RepID=A0ABR6IYX5_9HYPH|nr:hypothetical protein [Rhizobium mongolense]MBB4233121.1 hypothetical protein [Rhizobium mongolense]